MTLCEKAARVIEACPGSRRYAALRDEPMSRHTAFGVGGPADFFITGTGGGKTAGADAEFRAFAAALFVRAREEGVPVFALGGGANLLVADAGIRGIVLDMPGLSGGGMTAETGFQARFQAGMPVDAAAEEAARAGLSGLEFLGGMPGSMGGAVFMNARCYGKEIADALTQTEVLDFSGDPPEARAIPAVRADFSYKRSPFQNRQMLILAASFRLVPGDAGRIRQETEGFRRDRLEKGQFRYPSAGSVFKNDPAFGAPSGKIIDEAGLCGLRKGGARVAPWHGNIIINETGNAGAADVRALAEEVALRVREKTGFVLEPEIVFAGDWPGT